MNKKTKEKILRVVAMYLALNLMAEFIIPIPAHALTGGPSQPEVESFEPVGTTEMVNLFTGDFNYNIPLLTVPGPNGGYPINLAYHAGIGMEQEASWVGLGWNINPGVINRNMRGLPDDFDGDVIRKTLEYEPQMTWSLDYSQFNITATGIANIWSTLANGQTAPDVHEYFGFDQGKVGPTFSTQIHYNNYRGIGYGVNLSLTAGHSNSQGPHFTPALSLSFDTDGGLGVIPSLGYTKYSADLLTKYAGVLSAGYHSRNGTWSLSITTSKEVFENYCYKDHGRTYETAPSPFGGRYKTGAYSHMSTYMGYFNAKSGPGVAFSSQTYIPGQTRPSHGNSIQFGVTIGKPDKLSWEYSKYSKKKFNMSFSRVESSEMESPYKGRGFLYLQSFSNDGESLADFNREGTTPAGKNVSGIQPGYATQDVLYANGQGVAGVFKVFRSEYGVAFDVEQNMENPTARVIVEFGKNLATTNPEYELGGDYGVGYSSSYSGDWKNNTSAIGNLVFDEDGGPLYEPAYYRSTGEMLASPLTELNNLSGDQAVRFNLRNRMDSEIGIITKVENELATSEVDATFDDINSNPKRTTRQKRSQLLSYRTSGAIANTNVGYGRPVVALYDLNDFPEDAAPDTTHYLYSSRQAHHLGEITVTNPDGTRYVYGLPAYNNVQKEVMFAKDGFEFYDMAKTKSYDSTVDNSISNTHGLDHLYMSTEIPGYAYAYMVTAIYSADYVDLTGDGPSEDDFGYWVKFNYTKDKSSYGWRVPFKDANYSKAHISDTKDDKLSYTYGTKEVYYLNSVETKTHVARFILNEGSEVRHDGHGARSENNMTGNSLSAAHRLRYLKSIELISRKDPNSVIKTVHFDYDYSLCSTVYNSDGILGETGKLTLKQVWFTHLGNEKGQLSPYIFSYAHDTPVTSDDPDYNPDQMDRWGNYQPDVTTVSEGLEYFSRENPYVNQSAYNNDVNANADAWNLKKIVLPSGGEINIEYDCDDYGYVQDQRAMQMQRIVGFGETTTIVSGTGIASPNGGNKVTDRNVLIFFDLERVLSGALTDAQLRDSIFQYVDGVEDLYFKAFMRLKRKPGHTLDAVDDFAHDYVEGYAAVDKSGTWYGYTAPTGPGSGTVTRGWIKVAPQDRNPWNSAGQTDHPIKLAGWQYLRLERSDLFEDGTGFDENWTVNNVIAGFVNMANDFTRLFGYFNFCGAHSYCTELYLTDESNTDTNPKPSWIRLNSPDGKKYGGGHRVSSITISDKWSTMSGESDPITAEYGTRYEYRMSDGTSSGVAEYEPLIGGEENALKKPLRYEERKFPYRNDGLYVEEPFAEGLYPAPNVGYRRVIVRSINNDDPGDPAVTVNRTGVTVTEFYTAKDFPVLADYTDLQKKNFAIPIIIPFIGEISYNNKGYSQGFSLELNNMHGQIKSQAVYGVGADINNPNTQPTSKAEYIYQVDPAGGPNGEPKLSSRVTVLTQDGVYEEADLGKTHEFYVDRQQHSNFSVSAGLQNNAGAVPPYVFWTNMFPYFEISRSMYRSISTMKIIQRNGVLAEVREYKDGAFTVNKTLMYDAETGQPLLTQTINNFNRPVYTYNYASHWAYDGMGPAYKNAGAVFHADMGITSGVVNYGNAEDYFVPGDEVEWLTSGPTEIIWVSEVDAVNGEVTFIDEVGDPVVSGACFLRVIRSGRRNQQISTNGVIVSLSNPVTERESPFFTAFNLYDASELGEVTTLELNDFYTDCFTGDLVDVDLAWNDVTHTLSIFTSSESGSCESGLVFNGETDIDNIKEVFDYALTYLAPTGGVLATKGATQLNCTLSGTTTCLRSCLDNVLHAEAYRFKDEWTFNYLDFGNPEYNAKGIGSVFMASNNYPNPYRFGTAGIWRTEESWLYQVDRKQSADPNSITSVAGDGTYEHFVLHNWGASLNHATQNPQWTLTNTVTKYDPHGFEVENRSALDIYSSAMYGYGSSLPIAVASNTRYEEMAYEGFEDYENVASYEADVPHGHCEFYSLNGSFPIVVNNAQAHTGTYAMAVVPSGGAAMEFTSDVAGATRMFNPIGGRKYHISVWVKAPYGVTPSLVVKNDGTNTPIATAATPDMSQSAIDGWRQINYDFVAPAATALRLELTSTGSGTCYFDDLRIQPFTSGMKTYVYNPLTFWLVAELDDRNYATFYNYDEQGALVQVKKETENGVVTVRTSRSNTKR